MDAGQQARTVCAAVVIGTLAAVSCAQGVNPGGNGGAGGTGGSVVATNATGTLTTTGVTGTTVGFATTGATGTTGVAATTTGGSQGFAATTTGAGPATTAATTTAATTAASSSGTTACTPQPNVSAAALACPGGLCTIMTNMGYEYPYLDSIAGSGTTICVAKDAACATGTVGASNATAGTYPYAGLGINLGMTTAGATTPAPVQLTGTGLTIKLSNLPPGARAQVNVGGMDYCADIKTNPATIPWASFKIACYNATPGAALAGAPLTPHVDINLPSSATATPFNFCVEQVSWQ